MHDGEHLYTLAVDPEAAEWAFTWMSNARDALSNVDPSDPTSVVDISDTIAQLNADYDNYPGLIEFIHTYHITPTDWSNHLRDLFAGTDADAHARRQATRNGCVAEYEEIMGT